MGSRERYLIVFPLLGLTTLVILTGCTNKSPIHVSAASSLSGVLEEQFEHLPETLRKRIRLSTSGSQIVARQIAEGAPADLVFLAHPRWMKFLEEKDQLKPNSRVRLLSNRLVVITTEPSSRTEMTLKEYIKTADRIAMGNPESVPAGIYTRQSLKNVKIWAEVSDKSVYFPHVRGVLSAVASQYVQIGFVYRTDARRIDTVKVIETLPSTSESINYELALVKDSNDKAKQVYDYLTSQKAQDIFKKHGFLVNRP